MSPRPLRFLVFLLSLFLLLLSVDAQAQQNRLEEALFVSLPVSVKATSEQEGKKKATRLALRATFAEVLHRFVVDEERARALAQSLPEKQIRALFETLIVEVAGFDGERFTGQASVRFVLKKLFARLHKEKLQVSFTVAPSFVLIPVFEQAGKTELWPPQNLWLSAWKTEHTDKSWLVPITPIEANAAERLAVLDAVKDLQSMQAALLVEQYRAQGIALLTATVHIDADNPSAPTLTVSGLLNQQGFPSELPPFSVELDSASASGSQSYLSADLFADFLATLLAEARTETLYRLNRMWKEQTAHEAKRSRLRIVAELRSREEWTAVEDLLSATPELVEYGLRSLSARQAHVVAYHYGSPSLLQAALARRGLGVSTMKSGDLAITLLVPKESNASESNARKNSASESHAREGNTREGNAREGNARENNASESNANADSVLP